MTMNHRDDEGYWWSDEQAHATAQADRILPLSASSDERQRLIEELCREYIDDVKES
jgi:hypothetical protein